MKKMGLSQGIMIVLAMLGIGHTYAQWSYNGTHIYNSNTGNVGIGNSSPTKLLNVGKNMTEPTVLIRNFGGTGGATFEMIDDASGADWKFKATLTGGFKIRDNAYGLDVMTIEANSAANALYINNIGYVGFGTTNPTSRITVEGGDVKIRDNYAYFYADNTGDNLNSGLLCQYNGVGKAWLFYDEGESLLRINCDGGGGGRNDFIIQSDGDIGIGTATPSCGLEVYTDDDTYALFGNNEGNPHYFYHVELAADGDGQSALYGFRARNVQNNGSDYDISSSNSAVKGYNLMGDQYTFGVSGYTYDDYTRCGGVIGFIYHTGTSWGSLGYKNSGGNCYGGYFTSTASGGGKSSATANTGIGLAAWGDLMGADIHGKTYGLYTEGENYAMFAHGTTFRDNLDVHLQQNGTETSTVLYSHVSTEATVQTSGVGTLTNGKSTIAFDPDFINTVSASEPVIVTATPTGNSNGVYISKVTSAGFTVIENNAGRSNVTVNYIAIGKRAGHENPSLPAEVIDAEYTNNIARGLTPDAVLDHNGEGLYYANGQLVVGRHPSTYPDPNVQKEEIERHIEFTGNKEVLNDSAGNGVEDK